MVPGVRMKKLIILLGIWSVIVGVLVVTDKPLESPAPVLAESELSWNSASFAAHQWRSGKARESIGTKPSWDSHAQVTPAAGDSIPDLQPLDAALSAMHAEAQQWAGFTP